MFLFALFVYSLLVHRSLFSLYLCLSIVLIVLNIGYRETGVIVLSHTYCEKTLVWQHLHADCIHQKVHKDAPTELKSLNNPKVSLLYLHLTQVR